MNVEKYVDELIKKKKKKIWFDMNSNISIIDLKDSIIGY